MFVIYHLTGMIYRIAGEGKVDDAVIFLRHTLHESEVFLLYCPFFKLSLQVVICFLGLCNNDDTRCHHVEAVN